MQKPHANNSEFDQRLNERCEDRLRLDSLFDSVWLSTYSTAERTIISDSSTVSVTQLAEHLLRYKNWQRYAGLDFVQRFAEFKILENMKAQA